MTLLAELHAAHKERLRRNCRGPQALPPQAPPPPAPPPPTQHHVIKRDWSTPQLIERPQSVKLDSCAAIRYAVCKRWNCRDEDLVGKKRTHDIMWPRHLAIYLTVKIAKRSMLMIGRVFNRDHTSILHARDKVERLRAINPEVESEVQYLWEAIEGRLPIEPKKFDRDDLVGEFRHQEDPMRKIRYGYQRQAIFEWIVIDNLDGRTVGIYDTRNKARAAKSELNRALRADNASPESQNSENPQTGF